MSVLAAITFGAVLLQRSEPAWSHSALRDTRPDLAQLRTQLDKTYWEKQTPQATLEAKWLAAARVFEKSHSQADAFTTLYLQMKVGQGDEPSDVKYWKVLPVDEYEVARLRFLQGGHFLTDLLIPIGERLLAKDPSRFFEGRMAPSRF